MRQIIFYILLVFIGGFGGYLACSCNLLSPSFDWIAPNLSNPDSHFGSISKDYEAKTKAFPKTSSIIGKGKFIPERSGGNRLEFGYYAKVNISGISDWEILDTKARTSATPCSAVSIAIHFELLDKDGFTLAQVDGEEFMLLL